MLSFRVQGRFMYAAQTVIISLLLWAGCGTLDRMGMEDAKGAFARDEASASSEDVVPIAQSLVPIAQSLEQNGDAARCKAELQYCHPYKCKCKGQCDGPGEPVSCYMTCRRLFCQNCVTSCKAGE